MAVDKAITDLPAATEIEDEDYLVLQQNNVAKSVRGAIVKKYAGNVFNDAKDALLALLSKVVYIDENGQQYLDNLEAALLRKVVLSISAVFDQGTAAIYTHDTLDDLRQYLTVTANYDDGTSSVVTTYTLDGELTTGTSTITATYSGKTTTFDVTVTQGVPSTYSVYDYITCTVSQAASTPIAKAIILKQYANMNVLSAEFAVKPTTGHGDGTGIFGRRVAGTTGATSSYGVYAKIGKLSWQLHGKSPSSDDYRPDIVEDAINTIYYTNTAQSPSYLRANDGTPITIDWGNNNTLNIAIVLFSNVAMDSTTVGIGSNIECGYIKFFDLEGNLVSHYVPVKRNSDNVVGMYDIVEQSFYTSSNTTVATMGATGAIYAVGNWS